MLRGFTRGPLTLALLCAAAIVSGCALGRSHPAIAAHPALAAHCGLIYREPGLDTCPALVTGAGAGVNN